MAVHAAKMEAEACNVSPGVQSLPSKVLKKLEPIMMQTMKQEKTMPKGTSPALGTRRTGVQRNTKMYMQLSTMLCTMPTHKMGLLLHINLAPSLYDCHSCVSYNYAISTSFCAIMSKILDFRSFPSMSGLQ